MITRILRVTVFMALGLAGAKGVAAEYQLFARTNLVAWCIVPFDAQRRGPEARAEMLQRLGFRWFAYDYREEHISTFDAELTALARHNVRLLAWWFPGELNAEARLILEVLRRHEVKAQLWVTGGGEPTKNPGEQAARIASEAGRIGAIAREAGKIGGSVGLYNHGGWFGEPENQVAIIERLRGEGITNVGIVYNQHHGHDQVDRFRQLLELMKPHLLCLNLNGMVRGGDRLGRKIVVLGQGELDLGLLRVIQESGWRGPLGILNHTDEDAEVRLRENLEGLEGLVRRLPGMESGIEEPPMDQREESLPPQPTHGYWEIEDPAERERLPLYQVIPAAATEALTPTEPGAPGPDYSTWPRSHGDQGGRRYSALAQIHRDNVSALEVAWTYRSGDGLGNIQCNPIMVEGVLFAPTPGRHLVALDAATGAELWRFKPEGRPAFRGLVHWPGTGFASARVLFTAGSYLYALSPESGRPVEGFGKEGRMLLPGRAQGDFGAATAAPAIFERTIVVAGFERDVWGFDVVTGEHRWTFQTVPGPGEFGHETWDRVEPYAANCWGGMALDEQRGIAYVTTGSAKENFVGVNHRGRNLFANCLLALDVRTGKRLWHFQEVRHDIWDLDIPAPPNLATVTRDGRQYDVVAAVTKIGNTLLLDRVTGQPLFPFRLRRAPVTTLRGEATWPYQPDVELPEPFARQEFMEADVTDRTEEATEYVAGRLASATRGWFEPFVEGKMNVFFGLHGGAEWTGACVDPTQGRLFVSANHIPWIISVFRDEDPPDDPHAARTRGQEVYELTCAQCHGTNRIGLGTAPPLRGLRQRLSEAEVIQQVRLGRNAMPSHPDMTETDLGALVDFLLLRDRPMPPAAAPAERPRYSFNGYPKFLDYEGYPASQPPWGTLNCIDLNSGRILWRVPLGEHEELVEQGIRNTGTENFGGAIVTAGGLVFCSGTRDSRIRAFDADTGAVLWSAKLPWAGSAPPATYQVDGRQFLVIAATGGGKLGMPAGDAYVAFALPIEAKRAVPVE